MKSRLLLNLALLLALAALALYAYLRPAPSQTPEIRLSQLPRDAITRAQVQRQGNAMIELQRRDGGWHMLAPHNTRVDPFQVDRLLDIVQAKAKQKLPYENLDRYALDAPSMRVTLNDEGFAFGAVNHLTNEQYLATGGAVYLVAPFLGYGVAADAAKFFSHKLLGEDEDPIAFDFGKWQLTKDQNGSWSIKGSPPGKDVDLSQDVLNQWAAEWKLASSLSTEPHTGSRAREQLTVGLKGGR